MSSSGRPADGLPDARQRKKLASERTDLAEDRTLLANERTHLAWIRTGVAALAAGLAAVRFLRDAIPDWSIYVVATALVVCSAVAFLTAAWRHRNSGIDPAEATTPAIPRALVAAMTGLLVVAAISGLVGLWMA